MGPRLVAMLIIAPLLRVAVADDEDLPRQDDLLALVRVVPLARHLSEGKATACHAVGRTPPSRVTVTFFSEMKCGGGRVLVARGRLV